MRKRDFSSFIQEGRIQGDNEMLKHKKHKPMFKMKVYSCLLISLSTGFPLLLYGYLHIVRVISEVHSIASSSNQQPTGWFDDSRKQLCFPFLSRSRYSLEHKKGNHLVSLLVGTHILACLQNYCLFRAFLIVLIHVDLLVEHKPS